MAYDGDAEYLRATTRSSAPSRPRSASSGRPTTRTWPRSSPASPSRTPSGVHSVEAEPEARRALPPLPDEPLEGRESTEWAARITSRTCRTDFELEFEDGTCGSTLRPARSCGRSSRCHRRRSSRSFASSANHEARSSTLRSSSSSSRIARPARAGAAPLPADARQAALIFELHRAEGAFAALEEYLDAEAFWVGAASLRLFLGYGLSEPLRRSSAPPPLEPCRLPLLAAAFA